MFLSNKTFNDNEPIYIQIENYIKGIIDKNLLAQNSKLPATREMAKLLGVSRNSVITAYENLEAEGILYTIKGKGTFISNRNIGTSAKWNVSWNNYINDYGDKASELDIVKSEIPWSKDLISFKSISPEGELFNIEEVKKAFLNTISKENHKILNYGYAKGYKPLMEYILEYTKNKGIDVTNKDIIITNGFTEGLDILLTSCIKKGDKIICENPTHNTAIKMMRVHGVDIVPVKVNEDGIDIVELEKELKKGGVKFGYLIPSYHNPTGIVISAEKRYKVYEIFKKYNVPIIEDGFNEELMHNSSHLSPIAALDKDANAVVYISSFSKILFPGVRIGWIIADKGLINIFESVKRCKNIHTSFLDQGILYEYLCSGIFKKDIKKIRRIYREKYNFALRCVKKYIKPSFIWGEGGLHIYIGIDNINSRELLARCYEKGVIFMPGDVFSVDSSCDNTLRLGLSRLSLDEIEKGIKVIGKCVEELKNGDIYIKM